MHAHPLGAVKQTHPPTTVIHTHLPAAVNETDTPTYLLLSKQDRNSQLMFNKLSRDSFNQTWRRRWAWRQTFLLLIVLCVFWFNLFNLKLWNMNWINASLAKKKSSVWSVFMIWFNSLYYCLLVICLFVCFEIIFSYSVIDIPHTLSFLQVCWSCICFLGESNAQVKQWRGVVLFSWEQKNEINYELSL